MILSDVCLSVAYIGRLTGEQRGLGRLKEVAHVTLESDIAFKVRLSKVNLFDGQNRHSLRPYSAVLCFALTVLRMYFYVLSLIIIYAYFIFGIL